MTRTARQVETVLDPSALHLAEQYAEALAEILATPEAIIDAIDQLRQINTLLDETPGARDLLASPILTRDQRTTLAEKIFTPFVDEPLGNLLSILAINQRLELLNLLPDCLHEEANRRGNRIDVYVTTAAALDPATLEELRTALTAALQITPLLHVEEDAGLIGGLTVRIGDAIYDGSVLGELTTMGKTLSRKQQNITESEPQMDTD